MNQKASVGLIIVIVLLALIIGGILFINWAQRECHSNKDCQADSYCGSDFACHQYPQEIIVKENKYVPAAIIVGIALVASAYIYRGKKIKMEPAN